MIQIITKGLDIALRSIQEMGRQARFATSLAINNTVKDVQGHVIMHTHRTFRIRTGWLRRGGYGIQARFSNKNQDPIEGRVFVHSGTWWMKQHEEGGVRTGADVPAFFRVKRRERKTANTGPREMAPRKGFNVPIYNQAPAGTRKSEMRAEAARGKRFSIGDLFFVRTGKKKRDLRLVSIFKPAVQIKRRWGFYDAAQAKADQVFPKHFKQAMARAIATAKKK